MTNPFNFIKKHFNFLTTDFDCILVSENCASDSPNNCWVQYALDNCLITVSAYREVITVIEPIKSVKLDNQAYGIHMLKDFIKSKSINNEEKMETADNWVLSDKNSFIENELIKDAIVLKKYGADIFKLYEKEHLKNNLAELKKYYSVWSGL